MTTPEQSEGDRSRDELLAGEYVLGVLSLAAREKVEARMRNDRAFAAIVARWQENLADFDDDYLDEAPPAHVFEAIETRVFDTSQMGRSSDGRRSWWNSLPIWRGLAIGSLGLLVTYVAIDSGWVRPGGPPAPLFAQMAGKDSAVALVARYDGGAGRLQLTPVATGAEAERSLELWLVPDGGKPPISLGVLPQTGEGGIVIPANLRPSLAEGVTLAVSIEPFGGSPTGQPTGEVIASGLTYYQ